MDVPSDGDDDWEKKMVLISSGDDEEKLITVVRQMSAHTRKFSTTTDTDDENQKSMNVLDGPKDLPFVKNNKEKCRVRMLRSSSDSSQDIGKMFATSNNSSIRPVKRRMKKKKTVWNSKCLRRRSPASTDSSDAETKNTEGIMKKSSENKKLVLPPALLPLIKGRKNIRRIKKDTNLDKRTQSALEKEKMRKKRLTERHSLRDQLLGSQEKLVLDFDGRTKKEIIAVSPQLLRKLKPQQRDGVRFMWDLCFESLDRMKMHEKGEGGCILAHCMGLGKTLQVITLIQTLLSYKETNVKTILILTPATLILSWRAEFYKWLEDVGDWNKNLVYDLTEANYHHERKNQLELWSKKKGVMIINYEMFRSLVNNKTVDEEVRKVIEHTLHDPGPDLVICDEGHLLKNASTALSNAITKIKTSRKIILTGTPLQNNLDEYYNTVKLVRPYLLGTLSEFGNRFVNPIQNGQYVDSTPEDVALMKKQSRLLHKTLEGVVQRFDYDEMKSFLPEKYESVIFVDLSAKQYDLYSYYVKNRPIKDKKKRQLFRDYQEMSLIWTHPLAMKFASERRQNRLEKIGSRRRRRRRRSFSDLDLDSDSDDSGGSIKDFVVSENESDDYEGIDSSLDQSERCPDGNKSRSTSTEASQSKSTTSSGSDVLTNRSRAKRGGIESSDSECSPPKPKSSRKWWEFDWWREFVTNEDFEDFQNGTKLPLLFAILRQCELLNDKILIFSQSKASLDMIEYFLTKNDEFPQRIHCDVNSRREPQDYEVGVWEKGLDYFRMDGETPRKKRNDYCEIFNQPENKRARLFLLTSKTGGLGINLTAANRVIIFDAAWNPSHDKQAIFRICRFGQRKKCYIYRLISKGTMEEVLYERQVSKLSVARRVVDEHQVARHYTHEDLTDFYRLERPSNSNRIFKPSTSPNVRVQDDLMADLLKHYTDLITSYHEHDSLLQDDDEEDLSEGEEYEDEENAPSTSSEDEKENCPAQKANKTRNPGYTPSNIYLDSNIHDEVNRSIDSKSIMEILKKLKPNANHEQLSTILKTVKHGLFDFFVSAAEEEFPDGIPRLDYSKRNMVDENVQTKQYALVYQLVARIGITGSTEEISTPSTWRLQWNRMQKDPTEVEQLAKKEIDFRTPKPMFTKIGRQVLVHVGFDVDLELKRRLKLYCIDMIGVRPDFETAEALLGFPARGLLRQYFLEKRILSSVSQS